MLSKNINSLLLSLVLVVLTACGGGGGGGDNDDPSPTVSDGGDAITNVSVIGASTAAVGRVILPGAECANGGIQIDTGIDDNGNGILDPAEIDTSEVVCNGTVGADGLTALVDQTEIGPGVVCATGGVRFDVGKDDNSNGSLDAFEIDNSEFLCSDGLFGGGVAARPVIVSAISISNTEVVVQFSEAMMPADAENPINYDINTEGQQTTLPVWDAAFYNADNSTVLIRTFSQSSVGYVLVVSNMRDMDGNPIADPTILIDPSRTTFSGTEPSGATLADSDGDTLPDHVELIGWDVTITYGNGTTETRRVTSDPGNPTLAVDDPVNVAARDTDGEGVTDNEERHGDMDPRQPDTDGDTLTDNQEWNNIYSDPTNQDTDGDGTQDGFEFYSYRTSPILADTDGDQINDTEEVLGRNRDPRIADIPRAGIVVGQVRLQIDERYTYVDERGETVTSESSSSTTLSQSTNDTFSTSNTDVSQHVASVGFSATSSAGSETSAQIGIKPLEQKVNLSTSVEVNGSYQYTNSNTFSTSQVSHRKSQQVHNQSLSKAQSFNTTSTVTREIFGASIDVDVTIRNGGDLAFAISNLEITVLQADRQSTGRFLPVATLIANSTLITGSAATYNLGPFTPERGPILFSSRDVFPALVDQLLAAPGGLIFKVANFDMTDEFGRVFSFANQEARDRTAGIIVDFGDGEVEQHLVATALQPDPDDFIPPANDPSLYPPNDPRGWGFVGGFNPDGSPKGIPLDFALQDTLGLTKNATLPDGIVAGPDKAAQSIAQGDDVQLVPAGTTGLGIDTVIISAGQDGILNSTPASGDIAEITSGYETSLTCDDISNNAGALCTLDTDCSGAGASCSGPEVLVRFGGLRNGDLDRQWAVLSNRMLSAGADFGKIVLIPGADIYLAFVQDLDEDGLFAREEYLLGSTDSRTDNLDNSAFGVAFDENDPATQGGGPDGIPDSRDTDRDGLSDFAEARIGWRVGADNGSLRNVKSSPRLRDSDGDGLLDPEEQDVRTYCATQPAFTQSDGWCAFLADPPIAQVDAVAVIAGLNGLADSIAQGDDVQLIPPGTSGLTFAAVVIAPGPDGLVSTALAVDDEYASNASLARIPPATDPEVADTDFDGISDFDELAGFSHLQRIVSFEDLVAESSAIGDDVQHTPLGETFGSADILRAVILPGPNGIIDSTPSGGDTLIGPFIFVTDPLRGDTDGDLLSDGREIILSSHPLVPSDGPDFRDSDLDGISDAAEELGWIVPGFGRVPSNKNLADSDFDGLPDLIERDIASHPVNPDTDADSLSDFDEFADFAQYFGLEQQYPGFFVNGSASARYGTDPTRADTDFDGRRDDEELLTGYRILIAGEPAFRQIFSNPLETDTDLDGRTDSQEWGFTDATDPDTDSDGRTDGAEFSASTDPLVPDLRATIQYRQVKLNGGGLGGNYAGQWRFHVAEGGAFPGALVGYQQTWINQPGQPTPFTEQTCNGTSPEGYVLMPNLASFTSSSGLGNARSIALRSGQGFNLNGTFRHLNDCAPTPAVAGCDLNYFRAFSFEDLAQRSFITETIKMNSNIGNCDVDITFTISVD